MKRIITMRKKYKAFGRGDMNIINVDNPKVLAFTRTYEDETLLIVVNLSKYSQPAEVYLSQYKGYVPVEIFSNNRFPSIKEDTPYFFTLGPHSFQWFQLQSAFVNEEKKEQDLELKVDSWNNLLDGATKIELENNILPAYLQTTHWFVGKNRQIHSVSIVEKAIISLEVSNAFLLLVEVSYEDGLPENYTLPLTFVKEPLAKNIRETCPQALLAQIKVGNERGILCDAFYTPELQHWLFYNMANNAVVTFDKSVIHFTANEGLKEHLNGRGIKPHIHAGQQNNTSISYDNAFFLKIYRKVDYEINPDIELSKYLTEEVNFSQTPTYVGRIEWMLEKSSVALGMMQVMVENHGDGRSYMLERLNNYIERILAKQSFVANYEGYMDSLTEPVSYDQVPQELQTLLGGPASEQSRLLGLRTAMLHMALASGKQQKEFAPEDFSLHYQRSLFASIQSLIRETYQSIDRNIDKLPMEIKTELDGFTRIKNELLTELKKIYAKKFDASKIRIHGNLHLQQILLTGKDIAIHDFGGNPFRGYSERRIKRSPLRDVTSMIRSLYYVAHKAFFNTAQVQKEDVLHLLPFAGLWAHYMSSFFLEAYLEKAQQSSFIPKSREDLQVMLRTFLLEGAVQDLNFELNNRLQYVMVPLRLIDSILNKDKTKKIPAVMPQG